VEGEVEVPIRRISVLVPSGLIRSLLYGPYGRYLTTVAPAQRRRMRSGNEGDVVGSTHLITLLPLFLLLGLITACGISHFTVPLEQSSTCSPDGYTQSKHTVPHLSGLKQGDG
jgi:hypothetical protein